ncbi:MAG: flippase-like domain-containing protein [Acidimicrobiia bacterium]
MAWIAVIAAVVYTGVAGFVLNNFELPEMSAYGWGLIGLAAVAQIAAKWFFGLLYKDSVEEAGGRLTAFSAFKAALVGAGVARLIPAGGAITPVAMAWTVRDEEPATTGAAVRTVLLNYAGLLMMTGVGLLLARPRQSAQIFSISLAVLAPFVLFAGLLLMFGSGKLGSISKYLPKYIRRRLDATVIDHLPGPESQTYIWCRLLLEGAALGLVLRAFGLEVNVFQVTAAFGAAQLAGGLPGTPGGLGVTEAGLVFILSAYGFPSRATLAPVIIYRIVSYWLPAALSFFAGGMTFLASPEAKEAAEAD